MARKRPTTYWEYIRVEELISLQRGLAAEESELENEEVLFITVHQVFELWFKLILRELVTLRDFFTAERVDDQELSNAARSLRRIVVILRRCADHFEVMETLPTREYLAFRDKLTPASGFQSFQLRQIEILMGLSDESRIPFSGGAAGTYFDALRDPDGGESEGMRRVRAQLADRPSLKEAVEEWLWRTPIDGSSPDDPRAGARLDAFVERYAGAHAQAVEEAEAIALASAGSDADRERLGESYAEEKRALRAFLDPDEASGGGRSKRIRAASLFILTYRELPLLAWPREVLEGLIELEQVFLIFRQRHARMVERVIGRRVGTGGSSGVDYLDRTALAYRVFADLWACRTYQVRRDVAPVLENADFYGFANG